MLTARYLAKSRRKQQYGMRKIIETSDKTFESPSGSDANQRRS